MKRLVQRKWTFGDIHQFDKQVVQTDLSLDLRTAFVTALDSQLEAILPKREPNAHDNGEHGHSLSDSSSKSRGPPNLGPRNSRFADTFAGSNTRAASRNLISTSNNPNRLLIFGSFVFSASMTKSLAALYRSDECAIRPVR